MKKFIIILSIMIGMSCILYLNTYASNNIHTEEVETSQQKATCGSCRGVGYFTCSKGAYQTCSGCKGSGKMLQRSTNSSGKTTQYYITCTACKGKGSFWIRCSTCGGSGKRICKSCSGTGKR